MKERLLAQARSSDGRTVGGTRSHLVLDDLRIPWEEVERADWDAETDRLTVLEVGSFGESRPEHRFVLEEPGRLLELVRERVTASVVLTRRVVVSGRRGLTVVARRSPAGGDLSWYVEYDPGLDPDDPVVHDLAERGLAAAHEELG